MQSETEGQKFEEKMKTLGFDCAGMFVISADVVGEEHPIRGHVNFKPSQEALNIFQYVVGRLGSTWERVERLEVQRLNGPSWVHFREGVKAAYD